MRIKTLLAVAALFLAAAAVAIAATRDSGPPVGQQDSSGPLAATAGSAKTISHVRVARETTAQTTHSTSYATLPGATGTIAVPADESGLILVRFSAESQCSGGAAGNWCSVRILLDGTEMDPAAGLDFAFDSVNSPDSFWEAASMDRSRAGVGSGNHTVTVQWAVTSASTLFRIDDWSLTIERAQV
jgi:hypothetical protein